jgi:outer membrane lipoprotein SlyB
MNTSALPDISNVSAVSGTDGQIEVALKGLMDRYGSSLLGESGRLKSFLQDECPNAKREISVLLQALDEQVPQDLLRVHSGEPFQSLGPRLAKRLSEQKALAPEASRWAVRTWAQGLGVSAVAMDLAGPSSLSGPQVSSAVNEPQSPQAANDWLDISLPGQFTSQTHSAPPHSQDGGTPALDRDEQKRGWFSKPAARWTAIAIAVVVAALSYVGLTAHTLNVTGVDANGALVADGKKHDVQVSFKSNSAARNVQVRFIGGDGTWDQQPQTFAITPDAAAQGHVTAGQLGLRSVKPAAATFEYVLINADGKRGDAFQKTFNFTAGPADPPVIGAIVAPKSVPVGKPYSFTINYTAGAGGKIVSVERRVVESTVKWVDEQFSSNVSDLPTPKAGTITYPFVAMNATSHQTIEFVLVDESGARSEPKQVTYDVAVPVVRPNEPGCTASTCGHVVAVREFQQKAEGTGVGAVIGGVIGGLIGNTFGKGRGKTATTVAGAAGGAFAGHEGEKYLRGTKSYEVTIRLDSGATRTITQTTRVESGQRVRLAGGAAVATAN